jgi:Fic family protein
LAIVHAQFEIIHPFLDGNGRIGRILIPLFLFEKKILNSPTFYASAYFENHREEYYERLNAITKSNDWESWILFFLKAIEQQARENSKKTKKILDLYNEMKDRIVALTHSQFSLPVLDCLFDLPFFRASTFQAKSGIPKASVIRLLGQLKEGGIISVIEQAKGRKSALYLFDRLFKIVEQ